MNKFKVLGLGALAVFSASLSAQAGISPLGVSIVPPVEFPGEDFSIVGARISALWGQHRPMAGLDVGALGNMTGTTFAGIAVAGGFNYNKGTATVVGLQAAGGANINVNKATIYGLQLAGGLNSNVAESTLLGFGIAVGGNYGPATTLIGVEVGLYNRARTVYGLQIGLINSTENLHGLQIGLVNYNTHGLFAVAPILNVGF